MKRIEGSAGVQLIECVNPVRHLWRVRWDVVTTDSGTSYMEEQFDHQPPGEEVKSLITGWYNSQTEERILSGFTWNGMQVWLSQENQLNYKAACDLAMQTDGASLPVTFKFGSDENPIYHKFTKLIALLDFYTKVVRYIMDCLEEGWKKKDNFNLNDYGIFE